MPILPHYNLFGGCLWETGSVADVPAHRFPNSKGAISETMLLGISGGRRDASGQRSIERNPGDCCEGIPDVKRGVSCRCIPSACCRLHQGLP